MTQAGALVLVQLYVLSFLSWWHFVNVLAHSFVPPILRLNTQHPKLVFHRPFPLPSLTHTTRVTEKARTEYRGVKANRNATVPPSPLPAQLTGPGQVT